MGVCERCFFLVEKVLFQRQRACFTWGCQECFFHRERVFNPITSDVSLLSLCCDAAAAPAAPAPDHISLAACCWVALLLMPFYENKRPADDFTHQVFLSNNLCRKDTNVPSCSLIFMCFNSNWGHRFLNELKLLSTMHCEAADLKIVTKTDPLAEGSNEK